MRSTIRRIALLAALAAPFSVASAQFKVGSKLLSVGLLGGGSEGYGIGVGGAFEVGVKEITPEVTLGIGGFVGYTQKSYNCGVIAACSYKYSTIPIAAIGNFHYKMADNPKLDLYGGLAVGFVKYSVSSDYTGYTYSGSNSDIGFGLNIGGRYDFTPNVAGMLQLGGGSHFPLYLLGVTFKM